MGKRELGESERAGAGKTRREEEVVVRRVSSLKGIGSVSRR